MNEEVFGHRDHVVLCHEMIQRCSLETALGRPLQREGFDFQFDLKKKFDRSRCSLSDLRRRTWAGPTSRCPLRLPRGLSARGEAPGAAEAGL